MKLTRSCDHGTFALEFDEGREGLGSNDYAAERIAALMPRCPYCDGPPVADPICYRDLIGYGVLVDGGEIGTVAAVAHNIRMIDVEPERTRSSDAP